MGLKSDFFGAFQGMKGVLGGSENSEQPQQAEEPNPEVAAKAVRFSGLGGPALEYSEAPSGGDYPPGIEPHPAEDITQEPGTTIISKSTVIKGDIQSGDSLQIYGSIRGNVDCSSNLVLAGYIKGDTTAANAYITEAQIDGNLACDDTLSIGSDAWILGNVRAHEADIDGKIKGNVDVRTTLSVGPSCSLVGNITADELEIKRGAFINGQVVMTPPSRDILEGFDRMKK